jgi:hypothetical protein
MDVLEEGKKQGILCDDRRNVQSSPKICKFRFKNREFMKIPLTPQKK